MTDGILVQEMLSDPLLCKYSIVIIDDCHERSLYSDICLGLLKLILRRRKDLKLVISSATIHPQLYMSFFSDFSCKTCHVGGRLYPVELLYLERPTHDYVDEAVQTCLSIFQTQE